MRTLSPQRAFLVGLVLFFLLINFQYVLKVAASDGSPRSAFMRWTNQLRELEDGVNIWEKHAYPNPPMMALLLVPFAHLPPLVGSLLWFYLKVAMALAAICWVLRMLDDPERPFPLWGKVLAVLLSLRPIQGDLTHGNVNLFLLFLVVGCLVAFTRRRDLTAGLLLGLAIACKLTPALFLPYFLWKGAWKTLLGCAAGLILFFWLVPALFLGSGRNQEGLASWYEQMVKPFTVGGEVLYCDHKNQSLAGFAYRMLTASPSFVDYDFDAGRYVPLAYHNIAAWDAPVVRGLLWICLGAYVLLMAWICRTPLSARRGPRLPAEFALVFLGMLLFSERTWKHHCVTLLVPFAVLSFYLSAHWQRKRLRLLLAAILAAVTALMLSTSNGSDLPMVYGAYVWAFLLLIIGLVGVLRFDLREHVVDDVAVGDERQRPAGAIVQHRLGVDAEKVISRGENVLG